MTPIPFVLFKLELLRPFFLSANEEFASKTFDVKSFLHHLHMGGILSVLGPSSIQAKSSSLLK